MRPTRCAMSLAVILAARALLAGQASAQGAPLPLRVESYVPGIAFSALQALPQAPAARRADCVRLLSRTSSPAAAQVAAAGWGITGEATLGRFQTVAFVGGVQEGTSGSCLLTQGNLAVFDGTRLLAIAYATPATRMTIGGIEQLAPDAIRLWDGGYLSQPIADIRPSLGSPPGGGTLAVLPLGPEQRFCSGRAVVPNIYGMPIDVARRLLEIKQWSPVQGERDAGGTAVDGRESDLAKRGVVEVETCSGTGFGYCSFRYRSSAGRLSVTTVGDAEFPLVSAYDLRCGG